MKKPNHKQSLIAFLSSRAAAGEGSLKTWGRGQRPPVLAHQAERLADELVAEGLATVEERDSGRVWRLVRQEEAAPAPAPVEGSPPPAGGARWAQRGTPIPEFVPPARWAQRGNHGVRAPTPTPSPAPVEEPVLIAGDAAPSSALAPLTDGDRHQIAATLLELRARVTELEGQVKAERDAFWKEAIRCDNVRLQFCSALDLSAQAEWALILDRVRALREKARAAAELEGAASTAQGESLALCMQLDQVGAERDAAQAEAERLRQERNDLLEEMRPGLHEELAETLGMDVASERSALLDRVRLVLTEARAAAADPGLDEAAVAQYLLLLPEERWTAVAQARRTLTAARDLAARARELEAHALASVDRLLSTPAGEAPVEAPAPAETSSRRQAGSKASRVEAWLREHGQGTPAEIGPALGIPVSHASTILSNLYWQGRIERVKRGVYRTKVSAQ